MRFCWTRNRCLLTCGPTLCPHPLPPSSRSPLLTRLPPLAALLDLFPVLSATTSIILPPLPPLITPPPVNHTPDPSSLFSNRLLFHLLRISPETSQTTATTRRLPFISFFLKKKVTTKAPSPLPLRRPKAARSHPRRYRHFPSLKP